MKCQDLISLKKKLEMLFVAVVIGALRVSIVNLVAMFKIFLCKKEKNEKKKNERNRTATSMCCLFILFPPLFQVVSLCTDTLQMASVA